MLQQDFFESPVYVTVNDTRIATYTMGSGPELVFIHPAPGWSLMYGKLMARLSAHFTCIAFDLPGFGHSPDPVAPEWTLDQYADIVALVIPHITSGDATLMVHDSGGVIGVGALHRMQEHIGRFIVTDTFAWPLRRDFPKIRSMLRLVTTPVISHVMAKTNVIPWAAAVTAGGDGVDDRTKRQFLAAFNTPDRRHRVLSVFRQLLDDNGLPRIAEQNVREFMTDRSVLVMFGENDPARQAGFESRWRRMLPHATFRTIPGEKHFPHFGSSSCMADHIVQWSTGR